MTSNIRTSETHPIDVSWLIKHEQVGLTLAPGKESVSRTSGCLWRRDLEADIQRLRKVHGTTHLVCLLTESELKTLNIRKLADCARAHGMVFIHMPIPDGGVPTSMESTRRLVYQIQDAVRGGGQVVIHCNGGLGRSGVIAGAWLHLHLPKEDIIPLLRTSRSLNCPENAVQRRFIKTFSSTPKPPALLSDGRCLAGKVMGLVYGAAIGDAMGKPTEFISSFEAIRRAFGPRGVTGYVQLQPDDGDGYAEFTDDTQMAEQVFWALSEGSDLEDTMTRMGARFAKWAKNPVGGHRAPGNACLAGSRRLAAGVHWREAGAPSAGGCGAVMRVYPFALRFFRKPEMAEAWAVAHSHLTHGHPISLAACAAMVRGVISALAHDDPWDTAQVMIEAAQRYDEGTADMLRRARDEARNSTPVEVTLDRLRGWAAHEAIAAGLYVFLRHPEDPRGGILEGANTPGDSDSIATLAGALIGARVGIDAFPVRWVCQIERADDIHGMGALGFAMMDGRCIPSVGEVG